MTAPAPISAVGRSLTVLIALSANLVIAIAKTIAALITGSASMVAESAHSWADFANEIFLLIADRRSMKPRDDGHPLGYGREAYVWSMFAAFGIFTAGAVVSIWHGIQQLLAPEDVTDFGIAYIVLAVAVVLEGVSFTQAFRQARAGGKRRGTSAGHYALTSSNATLRAVFAEDAAALIGSIFIGLLLGIIAIVLIDRNRRFLVGEVPDTRLRNDVLDRLLGRPEIERVTYLHLEFVGPGKVFLVASVDIVGDDTETHVAYSLRRIEEALRDDEHIEEALLSLSTPDEPSLVAA